MTIELEADAAATIDGAKSLQAVLLDDSREQPTMVAFGSVSFYLVERSGRKGLRIKDSEAATRTGFSGLDNYPIDPSWRVEADWVAFDPPQSLGIPNVLGVIDTMPVPGKAVFERDGKRHELLPVLESADAKQLFFIFADRTSGKETYGAGRFLYAEPAQDGKVVLDFNRATTRRACSRRTPPAAGTAETASRSPCKPARNATQRRSLNRNRLRPAGAAGPGRSLRRRVQRPLNTGSSRKARVPSRMSSVE